MAKRFVRQLLQRNQVTLPSAVVKSLALSEGDHLEVTIDRQGNIQLRPVALVTAGTRAAKMRDSLAEAEIKQGRFTSFPDAASAARFLKARALTAKKRRTSAAVLRNRQAAGS